MKKDGIDVKRVGSVDWNKDLDVVFGKKFRKIIAQIIVKGIKDGINISQDIKGRPFKKLKASTVRAKRAKGQPTKPLIATGVMKKLPPVKNLSKHAQIEVAQSRSSIGMYHNEGGSVKGRPPKREWYGVTEKAKENIRRAIGKKVVQVLKKGYKP